MYPGNVFSSVGSATFMWHAKFVGRWTGWALRLLFFQKVKLFVRMHLNATHKV